MSELSDFQKFNSDNALLRNTPSCGHHNTDTKKLGKAVLERAGKTDKELPRGPLAEVAVTNRLLVLGYILRPVESWKNKN